MATASDPGVPKTLDAVLADIIARIGKAARDRRSPMHVPVVATICDGAPRQRIMVLRAFDAATRTLRFHTDSRAGKVTEIGGGSPASVLAYDPEARRQVRLGGIARIETDTPAVDAAWDEATLFARRCYLAEPAPGTATDAPTSGLPAHLEGVLPEEAEVVPARANFAILLVQLQRLEWLHLAHSGHRRAAFDWSGKEWQGRWLVP